MEIIFLPKADEDLSFWQKSGNKAILKKIAETLRAITENPYEGIGKPEPLKHNLSGLWSRRIGREHRIVYKVIENRISIYSLKGHYSK